MSTPSCSVVLILLMNASSMAVPGGAHTGLGLPSLADGWPDLQGVWDFRTLTLIERPDARAGQPRLTPEESAAIEVAAVQRAIKADRPTGLRSESLPTGASSATTTSGTTVGPAWSTTGDVTHRRAPGRTRSVAAARGPAAVRGSRR